MKIHIEGDGSFGKFLKGFLPTVGFELDEKANSIILAVPISAYDSVAQSYYLHHTEPHLINVCSVQEPSTNILLNYTSRVTSIHPLFGPRTPRDKYKSIRTYAYDHNKVQDEGEQNEFLKLWQLFSDDTNMTPEQHDRLMAKTHVAAVLAAKQAKPFIEAARDVPDNMIPNSFRLLREFVKTLDDMPPGTIESIMANPYA